MKRAKEIRVGLSIVVSAIILILGVRFFQALPLFRGTYQLYTTFEDASGILPGNSVRINGVNVGSVDEVQLDPEERVVLVRFHVDGDIAVPEGSQTEISGFAALNSVHLRIHLGPASSPRVREGGFIPSLREANILGQLTQKAPVMVEQLDSLLAAANAALGGANATFGTANRLLAASDPDVRQTLAAFRSTATQLDALLRAEQARLSRVLANFETLSGDLTVASADLRGLTSENRDSVQLALNTLNQAMRRLDRNLAGLETTTATLDTILVRIDRGDGTLGRLVNDPGLYTRLDSTLVHLDRILTSFERNPGRYLRELRLVDIF